MLLSQSNCRLNLHSKHSAIQFKNIIVLPMIIQQILSIRPYTSLFLSFPLYINSKMIQNPNKILIYAIYLMYWQQQQQCPLVSLCNEYDKEVITEWQRAYVRFSSLKYYLQYLKNVYERHHHDFFLYHQAHVQLLPLEEENRRNVEDSVKYMQAMLASGHNKCQQFIRYRTRQIIYLWEQLMQIIAEDQSAQRVSHDLYERRSDIKLLIRIIYAHTIYLRQFISLNRKIQASIQKIYQKYVLPFQLHEENRLEGLGGDIMKEKRDQSFSYDGRPSINVNLSDEVDKQSSKSIIDMDVPVNLKKRVSIQRRSTKESQTSQVYLQIIQKAAKQFHSSMVYLNKHQQSKLGQFTRFTTKFTSPKNYFLLGLYIGLGGLTIVALIVLLVLNFIQLPYDENKIGSMNYIFPMFRGVGLLILYLWGSAWNVYGFAAFKINFKNILEYGSHYSTHFQIMKRAGFFTLIFCLMLFLYLLGLQINKSNQDLYLPIQYTPFVVWTVYFLYIFFPNRQVFNPRGRKYFYLLVKKIALTPFIKMSFLISYATDQLVSFIVPIKDFAYTLCFYTSTFDVQDVKNCLRSQTIDGIIIAYVVAIVPLLLRMIQCFNTARQTSGKFIGHIQMWNFGKYSASVLTATLSFLTTKFPSLLPFFIASSVISTSYSYYWDLKYDWGFLEKGSKHRFLRNKLCYRNPAIYYAAILINLIFRCSWTLTISPSVVKLIPKSTFLPFLTGLIQIFRRCMWNFFRIEKQHVINCESYSIIKQKPEQILKRLRERTISKSFKIIDDGQSSIIHYVKLSDNQTLEYFKKLVNIELPLISGLTIEKEREMFMKMVEDEDRQVEMWEDKLKGHIFYNVKEKFY